MTHALALRSCPGVSRDLKNSISTRSAAQNGMVQQLMLACSFRTVTMFAVARDPVRSVQRSTGISLHGEDASCCRFHARDGDANSHPPRPASRKDLGSRPDYPRASLVGCPVPTPQRLSALLPLSTLRTNMLSAVRRSARAPSDQDGFSPDFVRQVT